MVQTAGAKSAVPSGLFHPVRVLLRRVRQVYAGISVWIDHGTNWIAPELLRVFNAEYAIAKRTGLFQVYLNFLE